MYTAAAAAAETNAVAMVAATIVAAVDTNVAAAAAAAAEIDTVFPVQHEFWFLLMLRLLLCVFVLNTIRLRTAD